MVFEVSSGDIRLGLSLEKSVVTVTLHWRAPEVTGGILTAYNVLIEAVGKGNSAVLREKRQTDRFLDNCIIPNTTNQNITVSSSVNHLDINASKNRLSKIIHLLYSQQ